MSRHNSAGHDHPFEDDYRGFDVREDEAARGPLILTLAVGVLVIFGGVVWNTYRQGIRPPTDGLPSVIADAQPFKQLPRDPGGQDIPHTDKQFYDAMDSSRREAGVSPALAELSLAGEPPVAEVSSPRDLRPPPMILPDPAPRPPAATDNGAAANALTLNTPEPAPPPQTMSAKARFTFAADGPFLVQIAALRSEEAAETAWRRVTASSPELYHGAQKRIQRADLGSEGVFYRLRVGAFAERSEAVAFCEAIKESGANCIVVTG